MQEMINRVRKNARWVRVGFFTLTFVGPALQRLINRGRQQRQIQKQLEERAAALQQRAGERIAELAGAAQQAASAVRTAVAQIAEQAPVPPRRRGGALWWIAGLSIGLAITGTVAYIMVRRFIFGRREEAVELPGLNGQVTPSSSEVREMMPPASASTTETIAAGQGPGVQVPAAGHPAENLPAEAQFIGNVRTGIYHRANSPNLPAEENRIYFKSRAEAEAMGFQPNPEEFATPEDHA
jgi:type II secretory pathway pseudopilin PulG